jgi:hypothetical protein
MNTRRLQRLGDGLLIPLVLGQLNDHAHDTHRYIVFNGTCETGSSWVNRNK